MKPSLVCLSFLVGVVGCSVTVKTQTKYLAKDPVAKAATREWNGEPILVENANGSVRVQGDPAATKVTVATRVFSFADNESDANKAIADVQNSISIDENGGRLWVKCDVAKQAYGSAGNAMTGCEDFTVTVPSGSVARGVKVEVKAHNGHVTAQNLTAPSGDQILIHSENGSVEASGLVGSATVRSENGDVTCSVSPQVGSTVDVSSDNGDVTAVLPSSFQADVLSLVAGGAGKVSVVGFAELSEKSTSRGEAGKGARSVTVRSGNGDVALKAQ